MYMNLSHKNYAELKQDAQTVRDAIAAKQAERQSLVENIRQLQEKIDTLSQTLTVEEHAMASPSKLKQSTMTALDFINHRKSLETMQGELPTLNEAVAFLDRSMEASEKSGAIQAAQIGVAKADKQLGLHESQLYTWRKQSEHAQSVSEREISLATENARLKRQLAQQAEELSILKNAATYSCPVGTSLNNSSEVPTGHKYEFMKKHRVDYSLGGMCRCFNVSRSGYYAWLKRKPGQRLQRCQALDEQVKSLFNEYK